jgi:hypothetical protein
MQVGLTERQLTLLRVALLQRCSRINARLAMPHYLDVDRDLLQASYVDSIELLKLLHNARRDAPRTSEAQTSAN